ncbi:penicillin acylase family protein [Flavobacterium sp.]|uniref:penicillin acylase family protein n=1 Tax=Flavobacterium sp. TaxID=239 RepID=UPI00286CF9FB|nr:penicillin acylase family protein [Flavobacterium sp.]
MKKIKKILLVLLIVIVILAIALVSYGFYLKPKYEGEQTLQNIKQETTVYFDDFGVPHIYANSQKEAMVALGYVHAQDRLWQMELLRRIAPGRLSEIFGSKALKNDLFFAGLGIDENSEKTIATVDKNAPAYKLALAYLDGINQYIEEGKTPIEFQIVGIKKEKFTLKDVYNIFGYMAFSFAQAQKTDPLMTDIRDKLGNDYLKDFGLDGSLGTTQIKNHNGKPHEYAQISKAIASLLDNSPVPSFIGSNSWVIAPQKTKNGKVLFANDPHIGFSQPSVWYEAHIVTPDLEIYGYYMAGMPFAPLAHNRDYAYGVTMFENDDVDLFQEEENPDNKNQYKTANGYQNYKIRKETIKVKDSVDVVLEIKETQHGPVMNSFIDALSKKKPIAMYWVFTQQNNQSLEGLYSVSHAKNLNDFRKGVALIAAPGLNFMYGDAKGNIAWNTAGKLYKLDKAVNPNFILNGANGIDDKKEFLDFSKNPHAINPSWNYVYSANNQSEAVEGYLYPGYYLPEDRAKRIVSLLEPKNNWTKEEVGKMMNDNTSSVIPTVVKNLVSTLDLKSLSSSEKQAVAILKTWNGSNNLKDSAPTIYNKWIYNYLKNTFQDELGKADFQMFLKTHIVKQLIATQTINDKSVWWDNSTTKNKTETRAEILNNSFHEAIIALEKQLGNDVNSWTWNRVHTLEHPHPLGQVAALRGIFNVGPFEVPGSEEVINNLMFDFTDTGIYNVNAGPSTRRVIDFSDIENSMSILPTGQSGNPFSKHYNDQAEMFAAGKFRKMKMNKAEIIRTSTKLIFKPK